MFESTRVNILFSVRRMRVKILVSSHRHSLVCWLQIIFSDSAPFMLGLLFAGLCCFWPQAENLSLCTLGPFVAWTSVTVRVCPEIDSPSLGRHFSRFSEHYYLCVIFFAFRYFHTSVACLPISKLSHSMFWVILS